MVLKPQEMLQKTARPSIPIIVLSEGDDPRVVAGGLAAQKAGFAKIILVGDRDSVTSTLTEAGGAESPDLSIHDPATSPLTSAMAEAYHQLRKHKGMDAETALKQMHMPLVYAAMLVREGHADGTVGGAVHTTGDVVRHAIQIIGMAPDAAMVSSFFLMYPPQNAPEGARAMLYADCGLVIDPSAQEVAEIAIASEKSARTLLQIDPKLALLSFSTKGSASHPMVDKMTEALAALQKKRPDIAADGELQFDAAFVPEIGGRKAPNSAVAGQANVMIFPDLNAGNISYKITQRLGGYTAIGPVMQGLAKPANDLSRGCSAEDVTEMIAVTALLALDSTA